MTLRPPVRRLCAFILAASINMVGTSSAQTTVEAEAIKVIRSPDAITKIGPDLFGDKVNIYNGSLEFVQTDVSLPGNSKLPVAVSRRLATGGVGNRGLGLFAHWDLELPSISGTFSTKYGWRGVDSGGQPTTARCSNFGAPPIVYRDTTTSVRYRAGEYWHGNMLTIPGGGTEEILKRVPSGPDANNNVPSDGVATPLVTKGLWAIRCLSTLASTNASTPTNENGEGFLAISPDGTQYRFDWLVSRPLESLSKAVPSGGGFTELKTKSEPDATRYNADESAARNEEFLRKGKETPTMLGEGTANWTIDRLEVAIFPTLVTDRYGNTVTYTYDTVDKWKLLQIVATDADSTRKLTFTYHAGTRLVQSVSDGTRTWTYAYAPWNSVQQLTTVTLPDSSQWNLAGMDAPGNTGMLWMNIQYGASGPDDPPPEDCGAQPLNLTSPVVSGSMVHPSGAVGSFTLTATQHGRNGVEKFCYSDIATQPAKPWFPIYFDSYALTKKTITGPGLPEMNWTTTYDTFYPGFNCDGCGPPVPYDPSRVSVTNPDGKVTRFSFGNTYSVDEGLIKQVDIDWTGSSALRTTITQYNQSFTGLVGLSAQPRGDTKMSARHIPVDLRKITQQGVDFTWQVPSSADFDIYRRPLRVTKSSTLGHSRTETTAYFDQTSKWILGQTASVSVVDGGVTKVPVLNSYNPTTGNLETIRKFGHLESTLTHHPDGNLASRKDGRNYSTAFSSYKRGVPRSITYPDQRTESYLVNDIGNVTSRTDQTGWTTTFGYDAMGRLDRITPPTEPGQTWNPTTILYQQVGSTEFDLGAGHWKQTITTGAGQKVNYFDAFWRPVYEYKADTSNPAATASIIRKQYNHDSRTTFMSYPQRDYAQLAGGIATEYDAVGRATTTTAASELGTITATNSYGGGFSTTATNGRGFSTVFAYQAFDEPSQDAITSITAPHSVGVSIVRDVFAKPQSITRGGNGKSLTRRYVYDAMQRLCKTIEPETGATVVDYDAASNVAWRASGLALPSTTDCNTASVAAAKKIVYGYDQLNRILTTTYGDASPGITRTYTADGLPETLTSNGSVWTYGYNSRRLNKSETLAFGGVNYTASRAYNANGAVSQLTYPDNASVAYLPNGLGEPTQVGAFATAITYHPSGAIKGFNYGNQVAHSLTQNVRNLPDRSLDAGILNDVYAYDRNANVTSILDWQEGVSNRAMEYDELDRMTRTYGPAMWGDALYSYDTLDNLTASSLSAGATTARSMTHNYPDPATNRLMSITGTAGFALSYGYDAQGNITQRGSQAFVFDIGNRLKEAPGKATYTYDGWGRRSSVVGLDLATRMQMYTQDGKLIYAGPTSATKTKYIYLHNHVIAEVGGAGTQYIHTDALGSPVARTNASGTVISRTRYEAYGRTASGAAPTIGFTGHFNDVDTGLTYMQQRYYDPIASRMLSIDPVTTDANTGGSFNRYSYANNSPYKYVDPDGRQSKKAEVAVSIVVKMKDVWTAAQRQAAENKVSHLNTLAQEGKLVKSVKSPGPTPDKVYGSKAPTGSDLDHKHDKQLGGSQTDRKNIEPLNSSVNRSLGTQIGQALRKFEYGTVVTSISILSSDAAAAVSNTSFQDVAEFVTDMIVDPGSTGGCTGQGKCSSEVIERKK